MIQARAVIRDGSFVLSIQEHGHENVCAGASAIMFAAALGLREMAGRYPDEIAFTEDCKYTQADAEGENGVERTAL